MTPHIPDPLKTLILEYLPFQDLINVSLCNRELYYLIQNNPSLWARHLFIKFFDPVLRDQDFLNNEQSSLGTEIYLKQQDGVFQSMRNPRTAIQNYYRIKCNWSRFLEKWIPAESQTFIAEIFNRLKTPQSLFPSLKRDIHHFPTNTIFQNFLTEVYFEVEMRGVRDRNSLVVENLTQEISLSTLKHKKSSHIVSLKWKLKKTRRIFMRTNAKSKVNQEKKKQMHRIIRKQRKTKKASRVKIFYKLVYSLLKNYCQMIVSYLTGVQDSYYLLQEYKRLWTDFVLLMIDYNQIFSPLVDSVNHFSIEEQEEKFWNTMRKLWVNQVYIPLSEDLNSAFCFLLRNYRCSQETIMLDIYKNSFIQNNETPIQDSIQLHQVLTEFYQALCDLSFNENTVFFWDCITDNTDTPKQILDLRILEGAQSLYEANKPLFELNPSQIKAVFEEDISSAEMLFGRELKNHITKSQRLFLEALLSTFFEATLIEARECLLLQNYERNFNSVNKTEIFRTCGSYIDKGRLTDDSELQDVYYHLILKSLPMIQEYLRLINYLKEELEYQEEKSDRKKAKLLKAGFEERYERKTNFGEIKVRKTKLKCDSSSFVCISAPRETVFAG